MHFQPIENMADDMHNTHSYQVEAPTANDLDDVFGSAPSSPTQDHHIPDATHPSDMRRLQTEHTTAGYREGVTVAKEQSIQEGFDEGFSVGASVGLKAGLVLGMLEGIAEGVRGADAPSIKELLSKAKSELAVESVFGPEFWREDGNWKFEVPGKNGDGEEVVFEDVAEAHPLVSKWMKVVDELVERWGVDRGVLDVEGKRVEVEEGIVSSAVPVVKKPLDW